ncbi:hypothetical protein J3E74DRAFT_295728 [Bipolaris maydis]|nr:hypothetical protein J3E74DRAFT_295887 [Bipolaris maydis]KAJ5052650.1 hypothetical protein J3E74DRAFT_295728 [Bipolaris maydis]
MWNSIRDNKSSVVRQRELIHHKGYQCYNKIAMTEQETSKTYSDGSPHPPKKISPQKLRKRRPAREYLPPLKHSTRERIRTRSANVEHCDVGEQNPAITVSRTQYEMAEKPSTITYIDKQSYSQVNAPGFAALSFHSRAAHIQRKVKSVKDISILVETRYNKKANSTSSLPYRVQCMTTPTRDKQYNASSQAPHMPCFVMVTSPFVLYHKFVRMSTESTATSRGNGCGKPPQIQVTRQAANKVLEKDLSIPTWLAQTCTSVSPVTAVH